MTLTVLAEDHKNPDLPGLDPEHGFSLLAELGDRTILYDFGAGESLKHNCHDLNINLGAVDTAILSHGHYDHADGLGFFLSRNESATICHGRGAFHPRWSISRGSPEDVGVKVIPTEDVVKRLTAVDSLVDREAYVILPFATGHRARPRGNAKLLAGPEGNRLQDDFTDELTLALRTDEGLVVVTGCSHRGILNIVDQVKTYCPQCPIRALIGGFHLIDKEENDEGIREIGRRLTKDLSDTRIITGHCTGDRSATVLAESMSRSIERLKVGMTISF